MRDSIHALAQEIPNLRDRSIRAKYRDDNWCCDPKLAGPGQPDASCSRGAVNVPDLVYAGQAGSAAQQAGKFE